MFILKSNHNNNCDIWLKGIACNCLLICDLHYWEHDGNSDRYCLAVQWVSRLKLSRSSASTTQLGRLFHAFTIQAPNYLIIFSNHLNNIFERGMLRSQHYTGYLCDDLIFVAGSGFNPVPDLVGRTLIYQYIIRLSSG